MAKNQTEPLACASGREGEVEHRETGKGRVLRLAARDQIEVAKKLIQPPKPNKRLKRAAKRHAALVHSS